MRTKFFILLLFPLLSTKGQSNIDSVISKSWYSSINNGVVFNEDPRQPSGYEVHQDFIVFSVWRNGNHDTISYKYYKDSLVLFPKTRNQYYDFVNCRNQPFYEDAEMQSRWVFYSETYVKSLPLKFKKLEISPWKHGSLEVDSSGGVFYIGRNIFKTEKYGHYRFQLSNKELKKIYSLLGDKSLDFKYLCCNPPLINSTTQNFQRDAHTKKLPPFSIFSLNKQNFITINYLTSRKEYIFTLSESTISELNLSIVEYLDSAISLHQLKFQNYTDGDSVAGIIAYDFTPGNKALHRMKLSELSSNSYGNQTFHLYRGEVDSLYYSEDSIITNLPNRIPIYLKSEAQLHTENELFIESRSIPDLWFSQGRAFVKPNGLVFREVLRYKPIPADFKPIVSINPNVREYLRERWWEYQPTNALLKIDEDRGYYTLWGLPYPFLRPDFQVAFEKYVLPDWEAYLKKKN